MKNRRFSFRKVFWVVLAVYLFFALLGFIAASITPITDQRYNLDHFLSWKNLLTQLLSIAYLSFFYYFTSNIFYRYILQKKPTIEFVKAVALAILSMGVYFTIYYFAVDKKADKELTTGLLVFSFSVSTVFQVGFSLLLPYLIFLRDEKKHRKILEEQKMQLEVEKSQANFNFLKAQINPHFLHNTLNFLYAKALPLSAELSEGILTLSDIMRYALSEGNARDGKAPLKDEIEHVRNVIKIQQLRFSNKLNVKFNVEGVVNGATIIPFVLITLVENAFKHGDVKNTESPIVIELKILDGKLYFYCQNKKKGGAKELSTGIGLDNIKKRLDLAYKSDYHFNIKDEADFYTTELFIDAL